MSKKLFFLLLAANIILLLWEGRRGGISPSTTLYGGAPVKRLVLLREFTEPPRKPPLPGVGMMHGPVPEGSGESGAETGKVPQGEKETASPQGGDEVMATMAEAEGSLSANAAEKNQETPCERIGPFADRDTAETFLVRLKEQEIRGAIVPVTVSEVVGYWIMYPPAGSLSESRKTLERLESQGFGDLWLFEQGPWKGAISLGMYTMKSRAETVAGRFRQQGLAVKVLPKQQIRKEYWLRLDRPVSLPWAEGLQTQVCDDQSANEEVTFSADSISEEAASGSE